LTESSYDEAVKIIEDLRRRGAPFILVHLAEDEHIMVTTNVDTQENAVATLEMVVSDHRSRQ
jgi:hypothetical protein